MNNKLFFKNPDNLKTEIKKLVSFTEKEDLLDIPQKETAEKFDNSELLTKYRKVLSCSFVKDSQYAVSGERIGAKEEA